ncbi:DUF4263 domain-containing protein [Bacillus inaquosorum]|uniref:DUF4263 domain-containing protein n=1 Tax=Bacillus inaquosorum TaxID=483913 RepID=UPI0022814297|nr:DUF4263 domain-containing protein [Bacillus inaquosorum]MCY8147735.1 DUF4263 domain-containing protein [Bacillus inaquosorum]MEC0575324.1 DUF4263 domain-containing protein [Bacillus inaquosorum]
MRLYSRDYTNLYDEEKKEWERIKNERMGGFRKLNVRRNAYRNYPKGVRHYMSFFPNNFLDAVDLRNKEEELQNKLGAFNELVTSNSSKETDLLNYINRNEASFIIGSILQRYDFGHHESYVFPEFQLGNSIRIDYLIVGRNSSGYHFIAVELEAPNGRTTLNTGAPGDAMRKGTSQIDTWKDWFINNPYGISETFDKYYSNHLNLQLPREFGIHLPDKWHYVVIVGKKSDFSAATYSYQDRMKSNQRTWVFHYDKLVENAESVIGKITY